MGRLRLRMYVLDPETTFKAVGLQPEQHSYCMGADQVSPFAPTCGPDYCERAF